ncbi:GntR family transcriptional regulator [Nocardia sp. NPDC052254]|uniref:GntR family transcriptional regulator n=1 Tax=Nocardia sp. NPDC052254 TaxID=3155681 RepID=UPI00343586B6
MASRDTALPGPKLSRARRSLTDEVRDAITEELILSGAIAAGERLPTEAELCDRYGVSRITVRSALRSLQDKGFIKIRQGLGSTVLPRPEAIASGIDQLCSFETFAARQDQSVDSVDVEIAERFADATVAAKLDIPVGSAVTLVSRTKLYGNVKVGLIIDWVPAGVLAHSVLAGEFRGSVLDVLLAHTELEVDHSDCKLTPVALTAAQSTQLDTAEGAVSLLFDELTRTTAGSIVNWSQAWLLPDHFEFFIRRTINTGSR